MNSKIALDVIIISVLLSTLSGVSGVFFHRGSIWGQRLVAVLMTLSMFCGLTGAITVMMNSTFSGTNLSQPDLRLFPWFSVGEAWIGIDSLSAFFLVPIFLVGGLGSLYGLSYWNHKEHKGNGRKLDLFWGFLVTGMALLVLATNALAFLFGWEIMALSAFFLVSTEDKKAESSEAGFIYIIATHIGTLLLFILFSLWHSVTGSYDFIPATTEQMNFLTLNILFFMALICFGLKAGMMPFHFWLPGAHANAPSHVSAILSGVVLKMGIYGFIRFYSLLPNPPVIWGVIILCLGSFSALFGVVFAIAQHDLKRLLAYHSVENIGIILMGLGVAMIGRSTGNNAMLVLGLAGSLLHTWNHSLFKTLLFFGAGSILHATGTRTIDLLGGLSKPMPRTAFFFLIGAVAICGLPPLNGFVSELFIYLGLFTSMTSGGGKGLMIGMTAPILATVGALAVACFVKVYGVVFSGIPQSKMAQKAHESPFSMIFPMTILATCCILLGIIPRFLSPVIDSIILAWIFTTEQIFSFQGSAIPSISGLCPLDAVGLFAITLVVLICMTVAIVFWKTRKQRRVLTWDCGYAKPNARMQYTASSFAKSITNLFYWALHLKEHLPKIAGPFPPNSELDSQVEEPVLDRVIIPAGNKIEKLLVWFHRFQQGLVQNYIALVFITLVVLLGTLIPFRDLFLFLFAR